MLIYIHVSPDGGDVLGRAEDSLTGRKVDVSNDVMTITGEVLMVPNTHLDEEVTILAPRSRLSFIQKW
jgi:hypothetical protein